MVIQGGPKMVPIWLQSTQWLRRNSNFKFGNLSLWLTQGGPMLDPCWTHGGPIEDPWKTHGDPRVDPRSSQGVPRCFKLYQVS
jgi:hypothetical protein